MATAYDPTKDRFASVATDPTFPSRRAFVVTLSDTKDMTDPTGDAMPFYAKRLYLPVAGALKVTMAGDVAEPSTPVTLSAVPAGFVDLQVRRVWTGSVAVVIALMD